MLSIREVEGGEIAEVTRKMENGCELDDREIWISRSYLG